jgi:hypothetical protein
MWSCQRPAILNSLVTATVHLQVRDPGARTLADILPVGGYSKSIDILKRIAGPAPAYSDGAVPAVRYVSLIVAGV